MVRHQADIYFVDDKAKIPIGKPGCPTSTGVQGKNMIAPTSSILSAIDHDIEALGNIIPTTFQQPDIPEKLEVGIMMLCLNGLSLIAIQQLLLK